MVQDNWKMKVRNPSGTVFDYWSRHWKAIHTVYIQADSSLKIRESIVSTLKIIN